MSDTSHWQPRVENGCLFIDTAERRGPMLQHHARPGIGSYIHPLRIGPRALCLTADSPWHHPHQHGIQTRFVGINGSDFWHFPGQRAGQTLGRTNPSLPRIIGTQPPRWVIEALLQHADGEYVAADRQEWQLGRDGDLVLLDLEWTLRAIADLRIEPYLYGGLYVRMPYHRHLGAQVVTSTGKRDGDAEQQPAAWVDVHMPIDQAWRGDDAPASAGIAVFDHPGNPGHPAHWRVDGQFGINPAPSIAGAIDLAAGSALHLRYRLLAHEGPLAEARIAELFAAYGVCPAATDSVGRPVGPKATP